MKKNVTILVGGPDGKLTKITGFGEIKFRSKEGQPPLNGEDSDFHNCCKKYEVHTKADIGTSFGIRDVGRSPGR